MTRQINAHPVPCNGCTLCCHADIIMLHPECGDDPSTYLTTPMVNPLTGEPGLMVQKKPGTLDCIYLGEKGCSIHERAPVICREFDCGLMWASRSRAERRRLVASGLFSREVFDQGRRIQAIRAEAGSP